MKIVLIFLLATLAISRQPDYDTLIDCLKAEGVSEITHLVYDLYNTKISFDKFSDMFGKWITQVKPLDCINKFAAEAVNKSDITILSKLGYSLLIESNCGKDLGPALIVLDRAMHDIKDVKTEWKQLLTNTLVLGIVARQSYMDCYNAWSQIRDVWSRK